MRSVVCLLPLLVLGPLPALAGEIRPLHHVQMTGQSHANCFCRAQGRMFAYGESVCLRTPEGPRLAQCLMELNVTSWTITERPCPES
jgi:hypothetical protein